jgi:DNA-binding response OmpR family regulator
VRQSLLLVEDQAVIAMDIAEILAQVGMDVAASAYSLEEARDQVWRRRFDAALMELKIGGEPTFGLADWLTAWNVPTVFLTDRRPEELPVRHRERPCVRKPLEPRELVFQVARVTGVLAPPARPPVPRAGPKRRKDLIAAEAHVKEARNRIARLKLLVARYPTPKALRLLDLHQQGLAGLATSRDLLDRAGPSDRG